MIRTLPTTVETVFLEKLTLGALDIVQLQVYETLQQKLSG